MSTKRRLAEFHEMMERGRMALSDLHCAIGLEGILEGRVEKKLADRFHRAVFVVLEMQCPILNALSDEPTRPVRSTRARRGQNTTATSMELDHEEARPVQ